MRFLDEHRRRPANLADHLPWAALVAPGVVLNKDGSFTTAFRFRGPDLESATEDELMAVRARLNNALKRLGTGWCLHMEARRRPAAAYPECQFDLDVAWLLDEERRERFEDADPSFETDFRLALTWLPPADETRRMERWLFDGLARGGQDWKQFLAGFRRDADTLLDLLADALPEIGRLDDVDLLTWLHDSISPRAMVVRPPETPMFLDAWLVDADLTLSAEPGMGSRPRAGLSMCMRPIARACASKAGPAVGSWAVTRSFCSGTQRRALTAAISGRSGGRRSPASIGSF